MKRSIIVLLVVLGLLFGAAPASAQNYWYYINGNLFSVAPLTVAGGINVSGGTKVVATQPALSITETWNDGAVTFAGYKQVTVDTASAAGSLPLQILCGAAGTTNCFKVDKSGNVTTAGSVISSGAYYFGNGLGILAGVSDGVSKLTNNAGTGFTTLNLGPTSGNSANGTLSITKTSTVCTIDTDTGCTGKTTNVVTMTAGSLPAASLILGVTCKNTVAITGSAGFLTYSVGDGSDVDRWGAGIAKALNTVVNIANYTTASPAYQVAAGSLVFGANGAETFTAGVISCTVYSINFTPIGS